MQKISVVDQTCERDFH